MSGRDGQAAPPRLTHPDGTPLGKRMEKRVRREMEQGTVFFTLEPECKLASGRLVYVGDAPNTGWEHPEREALLLRRLEWVRTEPGQLVFRGEFDTRTETFAIHTVDPENARITRRTVRLKRPVFHEQVLLAALEQERLRAADIEPTAFWKIITGWCREQLGFLTALCSVPFLALATLFSSLFSRTVTGTLEGFQERDGRHYPQYSYQLPDGRVVRRVEDTLPLEEAAAPEEAERILRRRYPRKVQVQYSRRRPEKSSCRYL